MATNTNQSGSLAHNPFYTFTDAIWPSTMDKIFEWSLWMWQRNGAFRRAIRNTSRYFVNDINIESIGNGNSSSNTDNDIKQKYLTYMKDTLKIQDLLGAIGDEFLTIGNVMTSIWARVDRSLVCPKCGTITNLDKLVKDVDYKWEHKTFKGKCKVCDKNVVFIVSDATAPTDDRPLKIYRWGYENIHIAYNEITGDSEYYYNLSNETKAAILAGDELYLKTTPWIFIEAAFDTESSIKLSDDSFFHLKTEDLSEMSKWYKGWGAPEFLSNFGQILRLNMLDRYNEAIMMDFIIPTRVVSPPPGVTGGMDVTRGIMGGSQFAAMVKGMVEATRANPTMWHVSPVPLQYQMIGGEAKNLVPVELLEWQYSNMLSAMGVPMEFKMTSFQTSAPTLGLRLFERTWSNYLLGLNRWLQWVADQVSAKMSWEKVRASISRTSFVEDDMNKQVRLQLGMNKQISMQSALGPLGLDAEEEIKKIVEEEQARADIMDEAQKEMEGSQMVNSIMPQMPPGIMPASTNMQMAMSGGMPPQQPAMPAAPAMPAGGATGGSGDPTIQELTAQSEQLAQQLYSAPDRRSRLIELGKTNPELHAMVKAKLDKLDSQVAGAAVSQAKAGMQ